MPEEPKDFPQSGADGSGQIGKQDWELPNSVSAPPGGFSPNVETASYGGYDESITDYHPPVEQGDIPHPFKVTRYTNGDGEVKVRVRLGRFYYSSTVFGVAKLPSHGPHYGAFTIADHVQDAGDGGTLAHTMTMTAGSAHWNNEMNSPQQGVNGAQAAGMWPINVGDQRLFQGDPADEPPTPLGPAPYFTSLGEISSSGPYENDYSLVNSIPYSFRLPLGTKSGQLMAQAYEKISDYIEFDALEEATSVWFRYVIEHDTSVGSFNLANYEAQDVVYVKDVLDSSFVRQPPTAHAPLSGLTLTPLFDTGTTGGGGGNAIADLVRANPTGWEELPPGMTEATFDPPPANAGNHSSTTGAASYINKGCYYIRLASLPAIGDEETYGGSVQQVIHDNISLNTQWTVNRNDSSASVTGHDVHGKGFGVANVSRTWNP